MDDLNGLQWTPSSNDVNKPPPMSSPLFPPIRATPPVSGRSTPLAEVTSKPPHKPATPANDSFANLVSFNSTSTNKNVSLQEQQKRIQQQKAQQDAAKSKELQAQYGGSDQHFWDNLGSGRSTPAQSQAQFVGIGNKTSPFASRPPGQKVVDEEEEDILAAFKSTASVDSSSHFPKPIQTPPPPFAQGQFRPNFPSGQHDAHTAKPTQFDDDDDPFGLSQMQAKQKAVSAAEAQAPGDDDFLGLLGKPISDAPKQRAQSKQGEASPAGEEIRSAHPQDKAVAELVDMGFPPEKARQALEATESGIDVQAAVGWLLHQAHEETKQRSKGRAESQHGGAESRGREQRKPPREDDASASAWMWNETPSDSASRRDNGKNVSAEKDPAQFASELGNTLFRTAGSLWKQGTKKVQQAVQEFNSDSESSTPKWMRESSADGRGHSSVNDGTGGPRSAPVPHRRNVDSDPPVTNEALMLESDRARPQSKQPARPRDFVKQYSADSSRDHSPAVPSKLKQQDVQPSFLRQQGPPPRNDSRNDLKSNLSRHAIEEQAASYTSSARRRKVSTQPAASASEPDLLDNMAPSALNRPSTTQPSSHTARPNLPTSSVSSKPRLQAPSRTIPLVPASVLAASSNHREVGTSHFKRGDFAAAHTSYTSALSGIPTTHPITIVLLTNRALTGLKIGEPKTALSDANNALTAIGRSKGESETITISSTETPKPMREFFGKALMRKAEALEQMEKWDEAATVWREAVEGGHGGATSMQGRTRCEKAANTTKPKPATSTSRPATVKKTAPAPPRAAISNKSSTAAVTKLRQANAAAEKADDEKFALSDQVDARLTSWKGGKADNLRALLSSLDTILWPEAGWKKIGMSELVLPNKVKIWYMKGIAKVHPDKIPTTATTEQRMISSAVFSTLNEAWEKFKKENNL